MTEPSGGAESPAPTPNERQGDPLDGLFRWTDHPAVRAGIVIGILLVSLLVFPLLAQWMF